jgi:hypothetical protein
MPTIKLTGFNTTTARIATASTTDDMVTDGGMTIGDADTDTIIVNAEFDSDLIPDDDDTYALGGSGKAWSALHVNQITAGGGAYTLPTSDGNPDDVLTTNGAGAVSFQPISSLNVPSFLVFGQNGTLTNQTSAYELKTTNGSQNNQGWRMPVAGSVTHLSVQFVCSARSTDVDVEVELAKNGVLTSKKISMTVSATGNLGTTGTITAESFVAGDCLVLYLRHGISGISTGDIAGMIRVLTAT